MFPENNKTDIDNHDKYKQLRVYRTNIRTNEPV